MPLLTPEYQQGVPAFTRNYFRQLFPLFKAKGVLVFDNMQDAGDTAELNELLPILCKETPNTGQLIFISRSHVPANLSGLQVGGDLDW